MVITFPLVDQSTMSLPRVDNYIDHDVQYWRPWHVVDMLSQCFNEHGPGKALFLADTMSPLFVSYFRQAFHPPFWKVGLPAGYKCDMKDTIEDWESYLQSPALPTDYIASQEYRDLAQFINMLKQLQSKLPWVHPTWR